MKRFGLIGYPLTHSFSKRYFTERFEQAGWQDRYAYDLYEIKTAEEMPRLFQQDPDLVGLNVTIPHKVAVLPFLDQLDASAERVGAVNVIKRLEDHRLVGYNSDYYGFQKSLQEALAGRSLQRALILGYGGAAKAIEAVLEDAGVEVLRVSRQAAPNRITYEESSAYLPSSDLIVNCTPLGTYPNVDTYPPIDYALLGKQHLLFDLVYNPPQTQFLKLGQAQGAATQNGHAMLVYQAERSWEIWQSNL